GQPSSPWHTPESGWPPRGCFVPCRPPRRHAHLVPRSRREPSPAGGRRGGGPARGTRKQGETMGVQTGMRGKDLQKFLMVARDHGVILLIRHTNDDSLKYVGLPGYYPKPAAVKAKTADVNPPATMQLVQGRPTSVRYEVAG